MRSLLFLLFIGCFSVSIQAQEEEPPAEINVKLPRFSFRLNAGVPNPTSNGVFRTKMIGIYEVNLAFNVQINNNFFAGLGWKNGLMSVTNRIQYGVNTKMEMNTAFLKIGYNHFHTSKMFSTFYLNVGYNKSRFAAVIPYNDIIPDKHWEAAVIEPGYSINFFAEDNLTLGFYTSFNYLNTPFNPEQVNFQYLTTLNGLNTSNNTTYVNIGVEMHWGLAKSKN